MSGKNLSIHKIRWRAGPDTTLPEEPCPESAQISTAERGSTHCGLPGNTLSYFVFCGSQLGLEGGQCGTLWSFVIRASCPVVSALLLSTGRDGIRGSGQSQLYIFIACKKRAKGACSAVNVSKD